MGANKLKIRLHRESTTVKEGNVYIARPPEKEGYCYGCDFYKKYAGCVRSGGECIASMRSDNRNVVFKRLG